MQSNNPTNTTARQALSDRLRSFIATATSQFTLTPAELVNRVEGEAAEKHPDV
jgi:hypothetical protein